MLGCDDDDAVSLGLGAACSANEQCNQEIEPPLQCVLDFKGGYCGLAGCTLDSHCPPGSACVAHTNGTNYCFRTCVDKPECNVNRGVDNEASCNSSVTWVVSTGKNGIRACVPPSGN